MLGIASNPRHLLKPWVKGEKIDVTHERGDMTFEQNEMELTL